MKLLIALAIVLLPQCVKAEYPEHGLDLGKQYYPLDLMNNVQWQFRYPYRYLRYKSGGKIVCFRVDESSPPPNTTEWQSGTSLYTPLLGASAPMTAEDAAFCLSP